jgi:hypothetical protein
MTIKPGPSDFEDCVRPNSFEINLGQANGVTP